MFLPRHPSLPRGLVASSPVVPWFPAGSATAFLLSTRFLPSSSPWHLHRRWSCVPTPHRLDSIRRIPTTSVSTHRRAVEVLHLPRQSRRRARRWRLGATQRKSGEVTPRERCLVTDSLVHHQLVLTRAGKRCTGWVDVNTGDAQHMLDDFLMKPEVTDSRTRCSLQCIYAQQVQASLIMC